MPLTTVQILGADGGTQQAVGDVIGGRFYPLYKAAFGAENAVTFVDVANPFPVSAVQAGAWNINNIGGAISLPTGASLEALQQQADLDTGAEEDNWRVTGLLSAEDGGAVLAGSANPFPVGVYNGAGIIAAANPLSVQIDGNTRDGMTNAMVTIDYGHHEVHGGTSFKVDNHKPVYTVGVPAYFLKEETINICFHTPAGARLAHMLALVDSSKIAFFRILRDVTITNGTGTDLTPNNRDEGSVTESVLDNAQAAPTVNRVRMNAAYTGGTVVHSEVIGEGKAKGSSASAVRDLSEYIRAPDTNYALELVRPNVAGDGLANIELSWYEHTSL